MLLPSIFALAIGFIYFLSDRFCLFCHKHKSFFISFVAGVSVSYIFLSLLPEFHFGVTEDWVLMSFLIGFLGYHIVNKAIYQKTDKEKLNSELLMSHEIGFIFYYFVIGIVLQDIFNLGVKEGVLFFVPVFLISGMSAHIIHRLSHSHHNPSFRPIKLFHVFAVLLGVWTANFLTLPKPLTSSLVGIVAGILTYIVIREEIPEGRKGKPLYLIIGALLYSMIIFLTWYI
ncbi:hypothetical protein KY308_02090 [Candidatus Woesearchaeota archaeon]|nr:hypothetical protein [Candidatus Woesearchaeota archaeon]